MSGFCDIAQETFGRLTALRRVGSDRWGNATWSCVCSCGEGLIASRNHLRSGDIKSCGCLRREKTAQMKTKHGHATRKKGLTAEYTCWQAMKARCKNPSQDSWKYYGGRGIKVCPEWRDSFSVFFRDMGTRPSPSHSIDRINPDGDYEPGNCRWATLSQQRRNRRRR